WRWQRLMLALCFLCLAVPPAVGAPCRLSAPQWDVWVEQRVDLLVRVARAAYEDEKVEPAYQRVVDRLAVALQQCRLSDDAEFVRRYPTFVDYVRLLALAGRKDHELGFAVSDRVYFAETQAFVTIPDFLKTPSFLRLVSRAETLPQAKAWLREFNANRAASDKLLFFSYESRHLGTPDNDDSFRRLVILVPGDAARNVPEKWVQFGISDPRARKLTRNISVVSVLPGPDQTRNTYFKDYFRTYRRDGSTSIKGRWELGYGDDNCVQCHKSGVLPIFPVDGTVSAEEKPVLDAVNA